MKTSSKNVPEQLKLQTEQYRYNQNFKQNSTGTIKTSSKTVPVHSKLQAKNVPEQLKLQTEQYRHNQNFKQNSTGTIKTSSKIVPVQSKLQTEQYRYNQNFKRNSTGITKTSSVTPVMCKIFSFSQLLSVWISLGAHLVPLQNCAKWHCQPLRNEAPLNGLSPGEDSSAHLDKRCRTKRHHMSSTTLGRKRRL